MDKYPQIKGDSDNVLEYTAKRTETVPLSEYLWIALYVCL